MQYFRGVDTACIKQYAIFAGDRYCLYETIRSIFGGSILLSSCKMQNFRWWILLVLSKMQYFWWSILLIVIKTQYFRESILLRLSNMQYFRGVDTAYSKQYAVFSGVDIAYLKQYAVFSEGQYCPRWAIRSMFGRSILHILRNIQCFQGSILLRLSNIQYFRGIDTAYTKQYVVFLGDRFCSS